MPGEYPLAQRLLADALAAARTEPGIDESTLTRALLHEVLELARRSRSDEDVISEIEGHIRRIEDGDDAVVTRGC